MQLLTYQTNKTIVKSDNHKVLITKIRQCKFLLHFNAVFASKMMHAFSIVLLLLWRAFVCNTTEGPPHIVIAIADDLGWSDLGYQKVSGIRTPHIDRLALNGIILTNHYVQPLCSPSRASLLTGRYPIHLGAGLNENVFSPDEDVGLPLSQTLLSEKLKELGYKTALFGKWHLGHSKTGYLPTRRGFDRFFGFYTGAIDYYTHNQTASRCKCAQKKANFLDFRDQDKIFNERKGEYSSAIFNEKAVEFIENHNKRQPMFLIMSYQNVHDPLQVPSEFSSMYDHIADKNRRIYAGMASYLDESVHNLTEAFKNKGMWNNTVFVFMSDNGGNPTNAGYNWPLRGAKGTLWEGGIKSVSFLSGGFLKASKFKSHAQVHVSDWFPTLLNLASKSGSKEREQGSPRDRRFRSELQLTVPNKIKKFAGHNNLTSNKMSLDGFDVWHAITSPDIKSPREYIVHNINSYSFAVRKGHWKLISELDMGWLKPPEGTSTSVNNVTMRPLDPKAFTGYLLDPKLPRIVNGLFDMRVDKHERHDVSAEHMDVVKELYQIVIKYNTTLVSHDRTYKCNKEAVDKANNKNAWGPFAD